jgi:hypothetical protein
MFAAREEFPGCALARATKMRHRLRLLIRELRAVRDEAARMYDARGSSTVVLMMRLRTSARWDLSDERLFQPLRERSLACVLRSAPGTPIGLMRTEDQVDWAGFRRRAHGGAIKLVDPRHEQRVHLAPRWRDGQTSEERVVPPKSWHRNWHRTVRDGRAQSVTKSPRCGVFAGKIGTFGARERWVGMGYSGFQDRCLKPLGHPSMPGPPST